MQFFLVYIREAHALDGFLPRDAGADPIVEDPVTIWERREVARSCLSALDLEPIPALVDTLDDAANRAYDAWPDRLYLIGRDGRVAYQGGPGPDEFDPDELEQAIADELRGETHVAGPASLATEDRSAHDSDPPGDDAVVYRCGDEWMNEADANDYHSRLHRWWEVPTPPLLVYSTCSRRTTEEARASMHDALPHLERIFGTTPEPPLTVILLRSLVQYNAFAITAPEGERVPPEASGFSAFHHAFPCEQWLDIQGGGHHPGAACAYFDDRTEGGRLWGALAARHATAHAFVERLDPSPHTVETYRADPSRPFDAEAYWAEKKIPRWLRFGAAMYCERYLPTEDAADPWVLRRWSQEELTRLGGIDDLDAALRCELSQDEVARSQRRLLEAGLLVAFVLDGGHPEVASAHADVRDALSNRTDPTAAIARLEARIRAHEPELRAFAEPSTAPR